MERMFPIQFERGVSSAYPREIPWSVAELAYSIYVARYGQGQTLQRLSERGGFAPSEMDAFLPGWRKRVDELTSLRAENAALKEEVERPREWGAAHDRAFSAQCDREAAMSAVVEAADLMWSELVEYQSLNSVENWRNLICAGKKYDEIRALSRWIKEGK